MSKKLKEVENEVTEEQALESDAMSSDPEADVQAAIDALEQDTELGDGDPLGFEEQEQSKAEQMAENGESTMELNGETVEVSKGAAKRFAMFDANGDGLFSKEEVDAIKAQIKKNNQTVGLKDNSDGAVRFAETRTDEIIKSKDEDNMSVSLGENGEDGVITKAKGGNVHYEGVLGSFDYNPKEWAIAYKTVHDEIGGESVSAEIPILKYTGTKKNDLWWTDVKIPDGVKNLDYTFEGADKLKYVPDIPDSVESMHATFKGCANLDRFEGGAKEGDKNNSWYNPSHYGKNWDTGGTMTVPDNVKDLSYCFEDCVNLREGFTNTTKNTQLENMDGYARNCKNIGTILDVSQAKFLPVSAQTDAYDGINTAMIKSIGGVDISVDDDKGGVEVDVQEEGEGENKQVNKVLKVNGEYKGISMYANEGSVYNPGKNETAPYSVDEREKLNYVKAIQDYRANDRMYLADPTAVANATNGMASTATYIDENGQVVHTTDPTQQNAEGADIPGKSGKAGFLGGLLGGDSGQLIQRLGFGFAEFALIKKLVKNPLIALGVTAGGQMLGVLPGTIGGIGKTLGSVGGMIGGTFGGMLTKLGDKFSDMDGKNNEADYMSKEEASDMNVITDAQQASEAQNNTMKDSAMSKLGDNMTKRGAYSAQYGTFQELAEVQEGYGVFNNVKMVSEDSMAAFNVGILEKLKADGGELSEESKAQISKSAKQILSSWSKYGTAASDSLRETYGGNPDEHIKGEAGLGKMMRASVQPSLEIIKGLDDKYGFFSEADKQELNGMSWVGLEGVTYGTYEQGMSLAPEDLYCDKFDEQGNLKEGMFEDYTPDVYDIDDFEKKAVQKHDLNTRTENYVSGFGDGAQEAAAHSVDKTELEGAVKPTAVQKPEPVTGEEQNDNEMTL